jgi:hypothetical protein
MLLPSEEAMGNALPNNAWRQQFKNYHLGTDSFFALLIQ